jgi:hypothetical protein
MGCSWPQTAGLRKSSGTSKHLMELDNDWLWEDEIFFGQSTLGGCW